MKKGHLIIALAGASLFGWTIAHAGFSALMRELRAVRIAVPVVLAMSLCRLALQTVAWSQALNAQGLSVRPRRLVGIRMASQSMGYLTVLGPVLSEPMKIKLLGTPAESTITATVLDDGIYWLAATLVGIAGWLSIPFVAVHGAHVQWAAAAITGIAMVLFFIAPQKSLLFPLVRKLGPRTPRWLVRAAIVESSIRSHRVQQPTLIRRMFWMDMLCQALVAAEVVVVLWALHLPVHLLAVIAIDGITRGVKLVSGWVPARLGTDEGGAISAFAVTGLSPALGLAFALTRRLRDLLWAAIGVLWLLSKSRNATGAHMTVASAPGALLKEAF